MFDRSEHATRSNLISWQNTQVRLNRMVGYRKQFEARIGMTIEELKNKIEELVLENKTSLQISKELKISNPIVFKYAPKECLDILKMSNKLKQSISTYKDGQRGLYKRLRNEIQQNKHPCMKCGSLKNIMIHHKQKLNYNEKYQCWKADNFINTEDNIEYLCSTCHQKKHYREYNRSKISHCKICGQFSDKTLLCNKCGGKENDKK